MELDFFESTIAQIAPYTKEVACHVMGDPLTLSSLSDYLDILSKYKLKALLTTSGYFLKKQTYETLFHPAVKQINISLNSFNKNTTALTLTQYLQPIEALLEEQLRRGSPLFINLRLWNIDEAMSERNFNEAIFQAFSPLCDTPLSYERFLKNPVKSLRLASKILLHFDHYFEWPSLNNNVYGDGTCQGLQSHIGILADGSVVPCCLDGEGVMRLGNLHELSLKEILQLPRTRAIIEGFLEGKAVEELCQKCSYKSRFNQEERGCL
jgi:radical SAM protein with 4Fe4S-binding SPASM domain